MADELNPNGNGQTESQEPSFTPEQEAAMAAARAQAEAMIRNVVAPMIEGSNKAVVAEMRKAISELGAAIPEAVDKCLSQRMAEAKAQRDAQAGGAVVEQAQPAGATVAAVAPAGGDNRMGQLAGLFQLLSPMLGIQPSPQSGLMGSLDQMLGFFSKINDLATAQNTHYFQGIQAATALYSGSVRAGADPADAARSMQEVFSPMLVKPAAKPTTAIDAAARVNLSQG